MGKARLYRTLSVAFAEQTLLAKFREMRDERRNSDHVERRDVRRSATRGGRAALDIRRTINKTMTGKRSSVVRARPRYSLKREREKERWREGERRRKGRGCNCIVNANHSATGARRRRPMRRFSPCRYSIKLLPRRNRSRSPRLLVTLMAGQELHFHTL